LSLRSCALLSPALHRPSSNHTSPTNDDHQFRSFHVKVERDSQLFLHNLARSFNIRICSSSQAAADFEAKPQEVVAVVWDGWVLADYELDVRSVQLGHDADDAVTPSPLRPLPYMCVVPRAEKPRIFLCLRVLV
jgi:hypothetical protein